MGEQQLRENEVSNRTDERHAVKRRGILAAAGAVVAGLAAKAARDAQPVGAADGDIIHVGDTLTGSNTTSLNITNNNAHPYSAWYVVNTR